MARDYYDVLGVSRDAGPDELQQAFRRLAQGEPPRREQGPGCGGALQGDQRGLLRAVRPGAPQALRPLRRGLPAGSRGLGAARRCRGRRIRWPGRSGSPHDLDRGGHRRRRGIRWRGLRGHRHRGPPGRHVRRPRPRPACGPHCGSGSGGRAPAHRGGGVSRRAQGDHAQRPGRPAQLHGHDPPRRQRRPADQAGRRGRAGARRRPGRRPLPGGAAVAAPALPRARPEHPRRPEARPVGGGARRDRPGRHARGRDQGDRASRLLVGTTAPAAWAGHAGPGRAPGRPVRRDQDHGAATAQRP